MMMVTQNVSDSSCCTVVRFSHEDTRTRTQQRSFVTVQHEDYLLFIKWKWVIEGLHPPLLTKAEEEEGLVLLSHGGWRRKRWGRWNSRRTGRHTWWNFMEIRHNFYLTFLLLISLKIFLEGTNPSSTICFSFDAHVVEGSMS